MKNMAIAFSAALIMSCGDSSTDKTLHDAGASAQTDAGGGDGDQPECFVPDECKAGEFCSSKHTCEARMPVDGACGVGLECQVGLYCLRTYDSDGLCKTLPATCAKDICDCYGASSEPFCDGPPSNCDPTGQTIYCTKLH